MRKLYQFITYCCLMVFTATIITGCGYASNHLPLEHSSTLSNCRIVTHALGEACVPVNPQRIVTIDPFSLENVLALGMQPVGVAIDADWLDKRDYLREQLTGVEIIGGHQQPNLEKILAFKPDLILGLASEQAIYPNLAQIAPTVLTEFETSGQWKTILRQQAEILDKTDALEQVMTSYDDRLNQLKAQMGDRLLTTEVSVVRLYPEGIGIYDQSSFIGVILNDAGLPRPPAQMQGSFRNVLSKEQFQDADGDVIFIWSNVPEQQTEEMKTALSKLQADPLWKRLKAVQQNQVYQVPSYWIGSSILSAYAVIDDLFRYLVEPS